MSELRTEISRRRTLAIIVPQNHAHKPQPWNYIHTGGDIPPYAKV